MSKLGVTLDILNQKGTPAFYSDIFTNRPAAGFAGRVFISTDTGAIYEDTGSTWTLIADAGAGTTGTLQQVTTNGNTTTQGIVISAGNLAIGTATAGAPLDIHTSTGTAAQFNGTTTNNAFVFFQNAGTSKWRIGNLYNAGANSFQVYDVLNATARLTILNSGATTLNGALTSTSVAITGGTSAQFLKADGTTDSNTYLTTGSAASTYLPLAGGTLTGALIGTSASFSSRVNVNGAVDNASYKLNTIGTTYFLQGDMIQDTFLNAGAIFYYQMKKARGTSSVPLTLNNGDLIGGLLCSGYDGTTYRNNSRIEFKVNAAVSSGVMPTAIQFLTGSSSAVKSMTIAETNSVLIGSSSTDNGQGLLQVSGGITASGISLTGEVLSASTTLNKGYYHVFTGGAGETLTLPSPSSNNYQYVIINTTANALTIAAATSTTITNLANSSVASITLIANARTLIIADGGTKYYQVF